jgi:predicted transcriptional regulator
MDGAPRTSREIEQITGLRQPEVSIAMRPLCSTGIVETWDEKHDHSRGRPSRYYRLCVPLHEIIGFHERRLTTDFREKKEAIRQLKKMQ